MAYNPLNPNGQATSANSTPVVIASDQSAVPVSAASLPLPTGAASSANQTNGTQQTKLTNGTNIANVDASNNLNTRDTASSATGSAVPSNASYKGLLARTSLPSAASSGNLVGAYADKFGRQVMLPQGTRDVVSPITQLTLTASTTETTLISAVASTFLDLLSLVVINTSATATQVDFRDSTAGTVRLSLYVPPGDTRGVVFNTPMPQNTVNNNWTAKCGTSVSSIIITGSYISNQ